MTTEAKAAMSDNERIIEAERVMLKEIARLERANTPKSKRIMTPLLEEFYNKLRFELRLVHTASKMLVDFEELRPQHELSDCLCCFETGPHGATVQELYDWFINFANMKWLKTMSPSEFSVMAIAGKAKP